MSISILATTGESAQAKRHFFTEHYTWNTVPHRHKTKKQWLKRHYRLKKNAQPVGTITLIFDKARNRPRHVRPVPPEECQALRQKLRHQSPEPADKHLLGKLKRAGQLTVMNLYDWGDMEKITSFKEKEAETLLGYMLFDGSHEDDYITEATVDGERQRRTWKLEVSGPDLMAHLRGERYYGLKKGKKCMMLSLEWDRHNGTVSAEEHITKVLKTGQVLQSRFPHYHFAPEITNKNGSVKWFGWMHTHLPIQEAERRAERLRHTLQHALPQYDFSQMEICPSTSPQVFAPLRPDKTMIIGKGTPKKVRRWRMKGRKQVYQEGWSCADYLNWVYFDDSPYDNAAFEHHLRAAVANCPDEAEQPKENSHKGKKKPKTKQRPGGMGHIGRLKGCFAKTLVDFWSERSAPEDDTIGKYLIATLRALKFEGMAKEESLTWVEERLEARRDTRFSDRLTNDFNQLQRVINHAADAVWGNNGYQPDIEASNLKLIATTEAWRKRKFRLSDPSTWDKCQADPAVKLVWNTDLLVLVPELAAIAHCDHDQAQRFLERVLAFVQSYSELALSMVGRLLEQCGIKGGSCQKQHDVRKFLADHGLIVKVYNYYHDKGTGYRHGNFYVCGLSVVFEHEAEARRAATTPTPRIYSYLSFCSEPDCFSDEDWLELLMEGRRLACDRRYAERRTHLWGTSRQAA